MASSSVARSQQANEQFSTEVSNIQPSQAKIATGLGWFSLALGLSEVSVTHLLARVAGFDRKYAPLLRVFGLREMTSGIGLLSGKNQKAWMWSRVVGDLLDGAFLGWSFVKAKSPEKRKRVALASAVVAPVVALDIYNSLRSSDRQTQSDASFDI